MKLKETLNEAVVHTPTEAEANELLAILSENGYKWQGKSAIHAYDNRWDAYRGATCYLANNGNTAIQERRWFEKMGYRILTLDEFKKLHVDFDDTFTDDCKSTIQVADPETKDETKGKKPGEKGNNSENSQLNLCKLLEGREGEKIWSPIFGNSKVKCVERNYLEVAWYEGNDELAWDVPKGGNLYVDGICVIYPSRDLYEQYPLDPYTAWMKWQEEQTIFHIRIEFQPYEERGEMKCGNMGTLHFNDLKLRTPADRDKCIEEIKSIINKYSK